MEEEKQQVGHPRIQAILFDLDGTIIDTYDLILTSLRYTLKKVLGKEYPEAQLMHKVGQPLRVQMYDYTDSEETVEELLRVYRDYNKIHHDELVKSFDGTEETLEYFRQAGFPMGIVTSKMHGSALWGLRHFGLDGYFDFVIGADDCDKHKPDPAPVRYGIERLGIGSRSCVYVGDSPYDIQSGKGADTYTVAALWGMFSAEELAKEQPDRVCERIVDLPSVLASLR